jgi:hypothetical protein
MMPHRFVGALLSKKYSDGTEIMQASPGILG